MNQKQKANLDACYAQIENDLPILFTLFSNVEKQASKLDGHIVCKPKKGKEVSVQYSLQLQKNDGKSKQSTLHLKKGEYYCYWVSHRYPLKNVDYYCLLCPQEPSIRIFVKKDDLKTGMNYFKMNKEVVFSDGTKIWDYAGLRDQKVNAAQIDIDNFKNKKWKNFKWNRNTSQSLWLVRTYNGTPQDFYTKVSLSQLYQDSKHLKYKYNNMKTASTTINRNSKNKKWTLIANGATLDVEYWVIKGDLNATGKLILQSFKNN
jgi:hypothetical protein